MAHDLIRPGRPAWTRIVSHFGERILDPDGTVNRQLLGQIVFSSKTERQFLNRVLHPLVLEKKKQAVQRLERLGKHKIFVSEAALTIESGFAPFFDRVVVVHCPERVQVKRLIRRDRITRGEAWKRIHSQMRTAEKIKHADYLIDTSGIPAETTAQAERLYRSLLTDYRKKQAREKRGRSNGRFQARRPRAGS